MCQSFSIPDDKEYHLFATKPEIDNAYVMHHTLLFGCTSEPCEFFSYSLFDSLNRNKVKSLLTKFDYITKIKKITGSCIQTTVISKLKKIKCKQDILVQS